MKKIKKLLLMVVVIMALCTSSISIGVSNHESKDVMYLSNNTLKLVQAKKVESKTHIPNNTLEANYDNHIVASKGDKQIFLDPDDPNSVKIFVKIFEGIAGDKKTLMEKNPELFLKVQKETGVDAIFTGTVMFVESGGGLVMTDGLRKANNYFSIKKKGSTTEYRKYTSVYDSILKFGIMLQDPESKNYIVSGKDTVNKMGDNYSPDPVYLSSGTTSWKEIVNRLMINYQNQYIEKYVENNSNN